MSTSKVNVNELFNGAHEEGILSNEAMKVLNNIDMGAQIQAALGMAPVDVKASEVILITLLIDDSGSIRYAGNEKVIIDGCNLILNSLRATKQVDAIQVHIRYLNGNVLTPYVSLAQAPLLDDQNYQANGGTPLYDQSALILGTVVAKTQEYSNNGVPVRAVTFIITDGHDESSRDYTAAKIKPLVTDLLMSENHIIGAMGIDDNRTDFRKVFAEMGMLPEWILTPKNSAHEIREAFKTVSQSAVRASQVGNFSPNSMGGFGTGNP